jgi:hypothetical protein
MYANGAYLQEGDPLRGCSDRLGLCQTVLITHGESRRSGVGRTRNFVAIGDGLGRTRCRRA